MANHNEEKILKREEQIYSEEKKMLAEEKKILVEEKAIEKKSERNLWIGTALAILVILGGAGGLIYWKLNAGSVYVEKSQVSAPLISLSAVNPGKLEDVYVNEGDVVSDRAVVARVGAELIKSDVAGLIVQVKNDIGTLVTSGVPIVTMIDPKELRVVGQLDEDKGLKNIHIGDRVVFTVDAFGGKKYDGIVDEISATSNQQDVVFNISDKRQVNQFDVKVRYDYLKYPELKNGMSARMWVYYQ